MTRLITLESLNLSPHEKGQHSSTGCMYMHLQQVCIIKYGNKTLVHHQLVHHILNHDVANEQCRCQERNFATSKSFQGRNTWLFGGGSRLYVEEFSLHVSMTLQSKHSQQQQQEKQLYPFPINKYFIHWHRRAQNVSAERLAVRTSAVDGVKTSGLSVHCSTSRPGWRTTRQW